MTGVFDHLPHILELQVFLNIAVINHEFLDEDRDHIYATTHHDNLISFTLFHF